MTGHGRAPAGVVVAALLLLLAACSGGVDLDEVASVASQSPAAEPAGPDRDEPEGPATVEPEGTGPEEPLPPSRPRGSTVIAGPGIAPGDTWAVFSAEQQTDCLRVVLNGEFPGDAVVDSVHVGPAGAFQRADDACDRDPDDGPRCTGFVFTDGAGGCRVGVRWLPDSRETAGSLSLALSGTCRSSAGACAEVRPGTEVTFTNAAPLDARLQPDGTPDAGSGATGSPSPGEGGGQAGPEGGSSPGPGAGTEAPGGGAAETPGASPDEGTP